MNILINCSNLNGGGGVQVADSICRSLNRYPMHHFIVVYPATMSKTGKVIRWYKNVESVCYTYPSRDWKSLLTGRNAFLDGLVADNQVQCVFTVFGPTKWTPRCPHLSGFALAHVVMPESPYFLRMSFTQRLNWKVNIALYRHVFRRSADCFYTENKMISDRLQAIFKGKKIYTVTNYYNQVFDQPSQWTQHDLPEFEGCQFLDITSAGGHKNVSISIDITKYLIDHYPDFKFRFVFTIDEKEFPVLPEELKSHFLFIGKVDISECPSLYEQCDISFQPTLLECFTATYPEAMRMSVPIVTTSMPFAKGVCDEAAEYYSPLSAEEAAEALHRVAVDKDLRSRLIDKGKEELLKFDNYTNRVDKLIGICEEIGNR